MLSSFPLFFVLVSSVFMLRELAMLFVFLPSLPPPRPSVPKYFEDLACCSAFSLLFVLLVLSMFLEFGLLSSSPTPFHLLVLLVKNAKQEEEHNTQGPTGQTRKSKREKGKKKEEPQNITK